MASSETKDGHNVTKNQLNNDEEAINGTNNDDAFSGFDSDSDGEKDEGKEDRNVEKSKTFHEVEKENEETKGNDKEKKGLIESEENKENLMDVKKEVESDEEMADSVKDSSEDVLSKLKPMVIHGSPQKKGMEEGGVQGLASVKLPTKRKFYSDSDGISSPGSVTKKKKTSESGNRSRNKGRASVSKASSGRSSRGSSCSRASSIDVSDAKLQLPFQLGWTRELVYRRTGGSGSYGGADVYYYSENPKEKLRSLPHVVRFLAENSISNLGEENFTFKKVLLGPSDPSKEWSRNAADGYTRKSVSSDSDSRSSSKKKRKSTVQKKKQAGDGEERSLSEALHDDDIQSISSLHDSLIRIPVDVGGTPDSILSDLPYEKDSSSDDEVQILKEERSVKKKVTPGQRKKLKASMRSDPQVKVRNLVGEAVHRLVNSARKSNLGKHRWEYSTDSDTSGSEYETFAKLPPQRRRLKRKSWGRTSVSSSESETGLGRRRQRNERAVLTNGQRLVDMRSENTERIGSQVNSWEIIRTQPEIKKKLHVSAPMELKLLIYKLPLEPPFTGSIPKDVWSNFDSDKIPRKRVGKEENKFIPERSTERQREMNRGVKKAVQAQQEGVKNTQQPPMIRKGVKNTVQMQQPSMTQESVKKAVQAQHPQEGIKETVQTQKPSMTQEGVKETVQTKKPSMTQEGVKKTVQTEKSSMAQEGVKKTVQTQKPSMTQEGVKKTVQTEKSSMAQEGVKKTVQTQKPSMTQEGVKETVQTQKPSMTQEGVKKTVQTEKSSMAQEGVEKTVQTQKPSMTQEGVKETVQTQKPSVAQEGVKSIVQMQQPITQGGVKSIVQIQEPITQGGVKNTVQTQNHLGFGRSGEIESLDKLSKDVEILKEVSGVKPPFVSNDCETPPAQTCTEQTSRRICNTLRVKLKRCDPLVLKYQRRTLRVKLERVDPLVKFYSRNVAPYSQNVAAYSRNQAASSQIKYPQNTGVYSSNKVAYYRNGVPYYWNGSGYSSNSALPLPNTVAPFIQMERKMRFSNHIENVIHSSVISNTRPPNQFRKGVPLWPPNQIPKDVPLWPPNQIPKEVRLSMPFVVIPATSVKYDSYRPEDGEYEVGLLPPDCKVVGMRSSRVPTKAPSIPTQDKMLMTFYKMPYAGDYVVIGHRTKVGDIVIRDSKVVPPFECDEVLVPVSDLRVRGLNIPPDDSLAKFYPNLSSPPSDFDLVNLHPMHKLQVDRRPPPVTPLFCLDYLIDRYYEKVASKEDIPVVYVVDDPRMPHLNPMVNQYMRPMYGVPGYSPYTSQLIPPQRCYFGPRLQTDRFPSVINQLSQRPMWENNQYPQSSHLDHLYSTRFPSQGQMYHPAAIPFPQQSLPPNPVASRAVEQTPTSVDEVSDNVPSTASEESPSVDSESVVGEDVCPIECVSAVLTATEKESPERPTESVAPQVDRETSKKIDKQIEELVITDEENEDEEPGTKELEPCSLHCPDANMQVPSVQCTVCLLMFHAQCQGYDADRELETMVCKRCSARSSEEKQGTSAAEAIVLSDSDSSDSIVEVLQDD